MEGEVVGLTEYERAVCGHAACYVGLVQREALRLNGAGRPDGGRAQLTALRLWAIEQENVFEALNSAVDSGRVDWLLPLAHHLQDYLDMTSASLALREHYTRLLELALRMDSAELELQARLGLGRALWRLGHYEAAREVLGRAAELAGASGDRRAEAYCLGNLGVIHDLQGEYSRAAELQSQALALQRDTGDRRGEAASLDNLGFVHSFLGDYPRAAELQGQALAIRRDIGERRGEAYSLGNLGIIHHLQGEYARAAELYSQALAIRRDIGDRLGEGVSLGNLGIVHFLQGEYARGAELYGQALALQRDIGDRLGEGVSLGNLGNIHFQQGEYSHAAELYSQALRIAQNLGLKNSVAFFCAKAGAAMAGLGQLRLGTIALQGGLAWAAEMGYEIDQDDKLMIDAGLARLAAAVAASEITADELAQWYAQGEAMNIDELAEFTLTALDQLDTRLTKVSP